MSLPTGKLEAQASETHNVPKLNNAWWRCTRTGNCNTQLREYARDPKRYVRKWERIEGWPLG
jgi:hypothetical protein